MIVLKLSDEIHTIQTCNFNNEDLGIYLNINIESITFTRDLYDSNAHFEFNKFLNEFKAIWLAVDDQLKLPSIRRIGFVTEQRFRSEKNANNILVDKLTKLRSYGFPAKFHLAFEDRINVGCGGLPDTTKDDFINIIRTYYDGSMDLHHPEADSINANLDVQRYYAPALNNKPFDEINKLKKEYDKAALKFNADLAEFGKLYAKAA